MKQKQFEQFISNYFPRWFNCLYAFLLSYFWGDCPVCHKKFGGHEVGGGLMTSESGGLSVCSHCGEKANQLNRENFS